MSSTNSISIKGQRFNVSSIISESFVYRTSDRDNHAISVDMSDEGKVTVKVDGKECSSYLKEIIQSGCLNQYVSKLYSRLASAYYKINDYYLHPYKANVPICMESDIKSQIDGLICEKYQPKPFDLIKPSMNEIESDLEEEARMSGIEDSLEIEKFVACRAEESYNYRISKWDSIRNFHNKMESFIGESKNNQYQTQYEKKKDELEKVIRGDEEYVDYCFQEIEKTLKIPFSTDIRYDYDYSTGKLAVDMESTSPIKVPEKKAIKGSDGNLQIARMGYEEIKHNQTVSMIACVFHIAWMLMNISTNIREISIAVWKLRNHSGWCWFTVTRDELYSLRPDSIDVIELCKTVKHVFDMNQNELLPMKAELFEYAIRNGKYDDDTLLVFTKLSESIAERSKTLTADKPNLIDFGFNSSLNDNDYGYNLNLRPLYDKSFANFAYKLLDYKICSIRLFMSDFGMTLDRAKDFMYKLLYLNMVSGKDENGNRKVLIETERALEYKLSWIFPNESWKY